MSHGPSAIERCRRLAAFTETPGSTTRTFLSPPMRDVHRTLGAWMEAAGMDVSVDAAGNLRGLYRARRPGARRLLIGSHVDTVIDAGAFDGILGVMLGLALVESLAGRRLGIEIELLAFSEEEGVRFSMPFLGSRALAGTLDTEVLAARDRDGTTVADAIRAYGLDPARLAECRLAPNAAAYLEFHIEQGPVLESLGLPLGVVTTIVGQSRHELTFTGSVNHAGTTPMNLRRDALAAACEWVTAVESLARGTTGLVATVGALEVTPGAVNVVPGRVRASLDVRHACDAGRTRAVEHLLSAASAAAAKRTVTLGAVCKLDQPAVACDNALTDTVAAAFGEAGYTPHRLASGAGHDAMVLAPHLPVAMIFLRTPRGLSHHPDEDVLPGDVDAAFEVGRAFLERWEQAHG